MLYAPKRTKAIEFIIEKACFFSGAISGAISGAKFFEGMKLDLALWQI